MRSWMWLICSPALLVAQDAYSLLPKNYKVEFDNEFVRVSRVRYFPKERLPEHSHPARPTVYVYLDDGGPIRFVHKTPQFTIERKAVTAGGVRFNRNAQVETHEVEYLGESPTEYLRVELKTEPGPRHRDARLRNAADFPWEDAMIRVSRVEGSRPSPTGRAVLVDVPAKRFAWWNGGDGAPMEGRGPFVVIELLSIQLSKIGEE